MSDLSKTTIIGVSENYLDIKIEEYVRDVDIIMNEQVKADDVMRDATVLAFLMDLGIYYANSQKKEIPLVYFGGGQGRLIVPSSEYNPKLASELIEKSEITTWCIVPPDLTDDAMKMDYEDYLNRYTPEQALYLLSETYFVARVYFKDRKNLLGFEAGMSLGTSLDTWICDWF
jgi:hypothetical protein